MIKSKFWRGLIYTFSTVWFVVFYVAIIPWLVLEIGLSLDWLVCDYFFGLNVSSFLSNYPSVVFIFRGIGLGLMALGVVVALKSWFDLAGRGKFFPLVILQKEHLGPDKLVTAGLYGKVRHPMFMAYLICLCGIAVYGLSPLGLFWVVPLIALVGKEWLKDVEEKELYCWFGEEYKKYQKSTPMLFPALSQFFE